MSELSKRNIDRLDDASDLLGQVKKEISQSENSLNTWKTKLVKWYELYNMVQSEKNYEGVAEIFVPEILRGVETIVSNLLRIITGQNPWFEYAGREKTDDPSARSMTQLVNYQIDENSFKSMLADSLRQMVITGLTVRKVLWDFKQINRKGPTASTDEENDLVTGKTRKVRKIEVKNSLDTIKDVWTYEPVDLLTFHISDVTTPYNDIQKARWIAEQYKVDKQWIRERIRKGWFAKVSLDELGSEENRSARGSRASDFVTQRNQSSGFTYQTDPKTIEIVERWGLVKAKYVHTSEELKELELDEDDMVESVIVVANGELLLKLEANPFWHGQKPYVSCPYVPQEFQFSGMGVAEIAESLQEELNDSRNQVMDNKTFVLSNMWVKARNAGINNKDLRIRPNGIIPANDVNGLVPLRPPLLTGVGLNLESVIKEDLRQSIGASSNLQGIAQAGVNTATESSILNKEAGSRLNTVAEMYAMLMLKPLFVMVQYLNYQYYDRDKVIQVIGEDGVKYRNMTPEELVGNKDVVINVASDTEESPSVKRQQLLQFFTILNQMPPEMITYHWKILDKMYKAFFPKGCMEDLYEAPPGMAELLSPDEEFELIMNGIPVLAKRGQDHQAHVQALTKDLEMTGLALSEEKVKNLQNLIASHEAMFQQEQQAALMQELQQMEMQAGGKLNTGQTPNASPFTQKKSNASMPAIVRDSRGGA